eukprot:GCRY01001655.1.p1 GENE.GCRY01001655.1~~GCRY01001655.1.p1  ORF type:complete len:217 (-),score=18.68 GCRY01001655.1:92-742(-)
MRYSIFCSIFLVVVLLFSVGFAEDDFEEETYDVSKVTCGSVIKLGHVSTGYRLHSHDIKFGSGSGQQSVTGFPKNDDTNSLWRVMGGFGNEHCPRGTPLRSGDVFRLQHVNTGKFLHSHLHISPLSRQQEVSCFGEGDTGDNWILETKGFWSRGSNVLLKHVDTGFYLKSSAKHKYGNPIPGQLEVVCANSRTKDAQWRSEEGYYFQVEKTEEARN